jgi:YD repeat-containing protein
VIDSAKRTLALAYNGQNRLMNITAPPLKAKDGAESIQRRFDLGYGTTGRLEKIHSPRRGDIPGHTGDLTYPALFHIAISYSNIGHQLKLMTDYEGNATTFHYDATTKQVRRIDHPRVFDFDYLASGQGANIITSRSYAYIPESAGVTRTEVTGERTTPPPEPTKYEFDAGRLIKLTDPLGRVVATYDYEDPDPSNAHFPSRITNVLGGTTEIAYDANGNPERMRVYRTDVAYFDTDTTFDMATNRPTQITDPLGQITQYYYDDINNPMRITRTIGPTDSVTAGGSSANQMLFQWGQPNSGHRGKLEQMTSPTGIVRTILHDDRGNSVNTLAAKENEAVGCEITSASARSQTGEPFATGGENDCDAPPAVLLIGTHNIGQCGLL